MEFLYANVWRLISAYDSTCIDRRLVEQKQKMVRIVGLSATLPNYLASSQCAWDLTIEIICVR